MAAATAADYGDVVLAEYTQPFNENDITSYRPLYHKTVLALNERLLLPEGTIPRIIDDETAIS